MANAFKHSAGFFAPLSSMTASMSELGRYIPVAKDPCTSNRAAGQMSLTMSQLVPRAAERGFLLRRFQVPTKVNNLLMQPYQGDCKFLKRSTVPGGHQRGFSFGSKRSSSGASSSAFSTSASTAVAPRSRARSVSASNPDTKINHIVP